MSVEQVGLCLQQLGQQRLEAEPAAQVRAHLLVRNRAASGEIGIGVPAASASNCAWHERSIVMNHHAASSTEWPTVSSPWLRRITAFWSPGAYAMRLPSLVSSTTPV